MGRGEDPVPPSRWFLEEVFLAALPVCSRRSFIRPAIKYRLKRELRIVPFTFLIKLPSRYKLCNSFPELLAGVIFRIVGFASQQLIDHHRLQFSFYPDKIQLTKQKTKIFRGSVRRLVYHNMRTLILT